MVDVKIVVTFKCLLRYCFQILNVQPRKTFDTRYEKSEDSLGLKGSQERSENKNPKLFIYIYKS